MRNAGSRDDVIVSNTSWPIYRRTAAVLQEQRTAFFMLEDVHCFLECRGGGRRSEKKTTINIKPLSMTAMVTIAVKISSALH